VKDLGVIAFSNSMLIKSVTFWLCLAVHELPARKACKIAPGAFGSRCTPTVLKKNIVGLKQGQHVFLRWREGNFI